ncbi:hypothetical protein [Thiothrix subterranea]|uniref:Uncharacterized protein n=1 Tax=Thiothrix subterranea TaxID=2735563 RepID=A0AA51R3S5_9GAMM|nr:hypothetical protein [Thiothrix subterranea]MDQ5770964.1 hypothetical protein [Thiothrix subterranea]WML85926.1 hypothetical protein RCG00_16680 [Thiothrix subterranea]
MNALRSQVLQEVALLDVRELLALQPMLMALKKAKKTVTNRRGNGAAHARQALSNLKTSLSGTVRENRL